MQRTLKKVAAFAAAFVLFFCTSEGTLSGLRAAAEEAARNLSSAVPEVKGLEESETGPRQESGLWSYAVRETDGWAVLTDYRGDGEEVEIPYRIDGISVAGLGSKAMDGFSGTVRMHGNMLYIAEDAFGEGRPTILALSGTYPLYWASSHGFPCRVDADYTLVSGVIDFSDAPSGSLKRIGDSYVSFPKLEGSRLAKGTVFWMKDARGMTRFYRVTGLETEGDRIIASVDVPLIRETVEDARISETYVFTEADFIPAEGVKNGSGAADGKARTTLDNARQIGPKKLTFPLSGAETQRPGSNWKASVSANAEISVSANVTYTFEIKNGEFVYMATEETQTVTGSVTASIGWGYSETLEDSDKWNTDSEPQVMTVGELIASTGWAKFHMDIKFCFSIMGSLTYSINQTSYNKKVYDFNTKEWKLVQRNGNSSRQEKNRSLCFKGEIKVYVKITATITLLEIVNVVRVTISIGTKASSVLSSWSEDPNAVPCSVSEVSLFIDIVMDIGVWVEVKEDNGNNTTSTWTFGVSETIPIKSIDHKELTGQDPWKAHFDPVTGDFHMAENCPYSERVTVEFNTHTKRLLTPAKVFRDAPMPSRPDYQLVGDGTTGAFLGWSTEPGSTEPNWEMDNPDYVVTGPMTLYAVWENTVTVQFNSHGGTAVADQHVPAGGYAAQPADPEKKGIGFMYWTAPEIKEDNSPWLFGQDTIPAEGAVLHAVWGGEPTYTGGTKYPMDIGDFLGNPPGNYPADPFDADQPEKVFEWELMEFDGEVLGVRITGVKGDPVNLVIPKELKVQVGLLKESKPVIDIAPDAFRSHTTLKSVVFKMESALETENLFLEMTNLEYVDLTDVTMDKVGEKAFYGCSALKLARLPAGIVSIDSSAFEGCGSVRFINWSIGLKSIGSCAFKDCTSLGGSLRLPEGIRSVGYGAFMNCAGLDMLYVPDSVETLGVIKDSPNNQIYTAIGPFTGCTGLEMISIGGPSVLGDHMFVGAGGSDLQQIVIRGTVKTIEPGAFCDFYGGGLNNGASVKLTLQEGVERIVDHRTVSSGTIGGSTFVHGGFSGLHDLTEAELPESLTEIGSYAFYNCPNLEKLTMGSSVYYIGDYAFSRVSSTNAYTPSESCLSSFNGDGVLHGEKLVYLGKYAFLGCRGLMTAILGKDLSDIETGSFYDCTSLQEVEMGGGTEFIRDSAFYGCSSLQEIQWEGVRVIEGSAFYGCTALREAKLPDGLQSIGANAFRNCTGLEEADLPASLKTIGVFKEYNNGQIYTPYSPFAGCTGLRTISIGGPSVIGDHMFAGINSPSLRKIEIRGTVKTIEPGAFCDFSGGGLNHGASVKLTLLEGVERIADHRTVSWSGIGGGSYIHGGFSGFTDLTEVELPESLTEIGSYAFYRCGNLKKLSIGSRLTRIGDFAFYNDSFTGSYTPSDTFLSGFNRDGVFHGEKLVYLGQYAFCGCRGLKKAALGKDLDTVGYRSFYDCTSLEEVILPEGIRMISNSFANCTGLKEIILPDSLEDGSGAFTGCTGLRTISIGGPSVLGEHMYVYRGGPGLAEVEIRGTVRTIRPDVFGDAEGTGIGNTNARTLLAIRPGVQRIEDGYTTSSGSVGGGTYYHGGFSNCAALTEAVLPESLTEIGKYAFYGCHRMERLWMGSAVAYIGEDAIPQSTVVYLSGPNEYVEGYLTTHGIQYVSAGGDSFTLALSANGGEFPAETGGGDTRTIQVAWLDEIPALEEPCRSEFVFTGWFTDGECTESWVRTVMPAEDVSLYAGWVPATHTLTLHLNGGTLGEGTEFHLATGTGILSRYLPRKEGCSFVGWYADPEGAEAWTGAMPDRDLELYAGWADTSRNAEYEIRNGGAVLVRYDLVEYESDIVYLPDEVDGVPVTGIAAYAFYGEPIRELVLPASLENLETNALRGMGELTRIGISPGNSHYTALDGVLFTADGTVLVQWPAKKASWYSVPDSVTAIGEFAFAEARCAVVLLPEGLQQIREGAFRGSDLERANLPDSLVSVGKNAFYGCESLRNVFAGIGIESIGDYAFEGTGATMMMYGPVGDCAVSRYAEAYDRMYNYYPLTLLVNGEERKRLAKAGETLSLPDGLAMGENSLFAGWYRDEEGTDPWGSEDLMPTSDLKLYAGKRSIFEYELTEGSGGSPEIRLTDYRAGEDIANVPETLEGIPVTALKAGCFGEGMREITVPDCVTTLEEGSIPASEGLILICHPGSAAQAYAQAHQIQTDNPRYSLSFEANGGAPVAAISCIAGEEIELPTPVKDGCAFDGWYTDETLETPVSLEEDGVFLMGKGDRILYAKWTVTDSDLADLSVTWEAAEGKIVITGLVPGKTEAVIPETLNGLPVTRIAEGAFRWNSDLTGITIPGTVEEIPAEAFMNCRSLKNVDLGEGIKIIGEEAFTGCGGITALTLPGSLERIESRALSGTGLTRLSLGANVMYVVPDALTDCGKLYEITVAEDNSIYRSEGGVLIDIMEDTLVKYPQGRSAESYTVPEGIAAVGEYAFSGARYLSSVTLPDSVWSLGRNAFEDCARLKELPDLTGSHLITIPDECFQGCAGLTEIRIPDNITRIGARAFFSCPGLVLAAIPAGVTEIGSQAFATEGMTISGTRGSAANDYADENGILFLCEDSVLPEDILLNESSLVLDRGEIRELTAVLSPEETTETEISWHSSDDTVVRVLENGRIRAVGGGNAVIYAVTVNGLRAECGITVPTKEIHLRETQLELDVGERAEIGVTFVPSEEGLSAAWRSEDESIASVDENGVITGVSRGTTAVTVSCGEDCTGTVTVTVLQPVRKVTVLAPRRELEAGESVRLSVEIEPEDAVYQMTGWSVDDESIAEIDENGLLTMKRKGFVLAEVAVGGDRGEVRGHACVYCKADRVLKLPDGLKEIDEEAFAGMGAEKVIIPEGTEKIGQKAFAGCPDLYCIVIPSSVTEIAEDALEGCGRVLVITDRGSAAQAWAESRNIPCLMETEQ